MNILEAVELMKIGKSVRRKNWFINYRVKMELGTTNFNNVNGSSLFGVPVSFFKGADSDRTTMPTLWLSHGSANCTAQIALEDVVATDWEIYE